MREAEIAHYQWGCAYTPPAFARVGWNENGIYALMYAYEETIRANVANFGGQVCEDSCLEFFLKPNPASDARYINVEINPRGVAHIGIGEGRGNRQKFSSPPDGFIVTHSEHYGGWWAVSYELDVQFLQAHFGNCLLPGQEMRGNFYTCDESIHPHFGACFPVKAQKPDFHRPEFFGSMMLI